MLSLDVRDPVAVLMALNLSRNLRMCPFQLLLEDQCKRKKQEDFDKKRAARLEKGYDVPGSVHAAEHTVEEDVPCGSDGTVVPIKKKIKKTAARKLVVGKVTPRKSPRVSRPAEVVEDEGFGLGGTPCRSPHVLATAAPTPSPLGAGAVQGSTCKGQQGCEEAFSC